MMKKLLLPIWLLATATNFVHDINATNIGKIYDIYFYSSNEVNKNTNYFKEENNILKDYLNIEDAYGTPGFDNYISMEIVGTTWGVFKKDLFEKLGIEKESHKNILLYKNSVETDSDDDDNDNDGPALVKENDKGDPSDIDETGNSVSIVILNDDKVIESIKERKKTERKKEEKKIKKEKEEKEEIQKKRQKKQNRRLEKGLKVGTFFLILVAACGAIYYFFIRKEEEQKVVQTTEEEITETETENGVDE